MFCKQRRFGTPRTVHHTKSWLKLSFYRSIRIYRVDFEKIYISPFFFFFFFLERQYAVRGRRKAETSLRLRVHYPCLKIRHLKRDLIPWNMLAAFFTMQRCTISNTSLIFDSNTTQILNHSQIAAAVKICLF